MAEAWQVVFRVDASLTMGTGHVMRCLTLADALTAQGAHCEFVSRAHAGHLMDHVKRQGYAVRVLPPLTEAVPGSEPQLAHSDWLGTSQAQDAQDTLASLQGQRVDWLVVDHYALSAPWEHALRPLCRRLMVMDDLADRTHDCDLLLDPNLGRAASDYAGLMPPGTALLTGPRYALLRPEFAQLRTASLAKREQPQLQRLLITLGGVDAGNATGEVLKALQAAPLPAGLQITVVMGPHAPWLTQVQAQVAAMPCPVHVLTGVKNMAELMAHSDLAIGAAGGTAWERCCLGLPSLVLVLADNQRPGAKALQASGAAVVVQSADEIPAFFAALAAEVQSTPRLAEPTAKLAMMGRAAQQVTDGLGAVRVVQHLLEQA